MGCGGPRFNIPIPYPYPAPQSPVPERRESAKDILKMRLAQGEITIQEYEEMLSVLDDNVASRPHRRKSHIRMP